MEISNPVTVLAAEENWWFPKISLPITGIFEADVVQGK
jgi:hypothetical protein